MSSHTRVRLVLYSVSAMIAILSVAVFTGCGTSYSSDGKARVSVGLVYEQDRKESFNSSWGKNAWNNGATPAHNPFPQNASPAVR